MNAPARFHLPLVAHVEITAPTDRVRCPTFSADLTAAACADRTLALKLKPGHRRSGRVMTGVARYATCAGCPLGAEARARLAMKGQPGRVDRVNLNLQGLRPLLIEAADSARAPRQTPSAADADALLALGWTRDAAGWLDPHGQQFSDDAVARIASGERALLSMIPKHRRPVAPGRAA